MKAWFVQNEIDLYESTSIRDLSEHAQRELMKAKCDQLLHTYQERSGPNCFAAAAAVAGG
jgi:hypothetical protein